MPSTSARARRKNSRTNSNKPKRADNNLALSHFEFEGFRTVMPAQAGIQRDQAAAAGYSAWIPAFAGMTQPSSIPQNHPGRLLSRTPQDSYITVAPRAASARRSSVGLNAQSLVNQAPRGLQPPSQPE